MTVRSSLGPQLERAELYSRDSAGNEIRQPDPAAIGTTVIPVRETRTHALSRGSDVSPEEAVVAKGAYETALATLTAEEHAVILALQRRVMEPVERVISDATELADAYAEGWLYVRRNNDGGMVMRIDAWRWQSYEEVGAQLHLSARQVKSRLVTANKKLGVSRGRR